MTGEGLVDQWESAWRELHPQRLSALFTEDGVYEDAALGVVHKGRADIEGYLVWARGVFPDFGPEVHVRLSSGDWASAEWTMRGTHEGDLPDVPATGRSFSVRGASIFRLRDGKIARCTDYWNMTDMLKQFGVMG